MRDLHRVARATDGTAREHAPTGNDAARHGEFLPPECLRVAPPRDRRCIHLKWRGAGQPFPQLPFESIPDALAQRN